MASWGAAEFGQVGHKEAAGSVDSVQPRIVKGTRELQFVRVACGAAHTVALTGVSFSSILMTIFFTLSLQLSNQLFELCERNFSLLLAKRVAMA